MSCRHCRLPTGAVVFARETSEARLIYRYGGCAYKVLRSRVTPAFVYSRMRVATANPDIIAPIEYDAATHTEIRPWLGDAAPTTATLSRLRAVVQLRRLGISDITFENVRGDLLIDFTLQAERATPVMAPGITRRGHTIVIHAATAEQLHAAGVGPALVWPSGILMPRTVPQ